MVLGEVWVLSIVAFLVSLFTSTVGVSGAFLLLPFQVSVLGFISPAVSGTNLVYNLIAIPSGVFRYVREGRLVWPLVWISALGTLPGVWLGAYVRAYWLSDVKLFKVFVAMVLFWLGARLLLARVSAAVLPRAVVEVGEVSFSRVVYKLGGVTYSFSPPKLFLAAFLVGLVGGVYGIGGGAILSPVLAGLFKLPVYTTAGATLLCTFLTSAFGVASYYTVGYPPRWDIGIALGVGGAFGMYAGARLQKHIPEKALRTLLALTTLAIAAGYILGL
ncbi:MAG: sulfite exporter TauE/SafE family protein [Pyrobaculum sp.]